MTALDRLHSSLSTWCLQTISDPAPAPFSDLKRVTRTLRHHEVATTTLRLRSQTAFQALCLLPQNAAFKSAFLCGRLDSRPRRPHQPEYWASPPSDETRSLARAGVKSSCGSLLLVPKGLPGCWRSPPRRRRGSCRRRPERCCRCRGRSPSQAARRQDFRCDRKRMCSE